MAQAIQEAIESQTLGGAMTEGEREAQRERVREMAARLIGASPDEVAFVSNTAHGLSLVAAGLPWQPGDNVVTAAVEYPSNVFPWQNLVRFGVECRLVPGRDGRLELEDLFGAVDRRTRAVAISFVEFASGQRNDLATIGRFCRDRGIRFVVDGVQGLGVLPLDVQAWGVDFLSAGAHKWLLGPQGIGILYVRRERLEELWVSQVGEDGMVRRPDYLDYRANFLPSAARFEGGASNYPGIYGLGASLALLHRIGVEQVESRVLALVKRLLDGLRTRGYRVTGVEAPAELSGIVSFRSPHHSDHEVHQALERAGVHTAVRSLGVRASPHFYNTEAEVDRLLDALP